MNTKNSISQKKVSGERCNDQDKVIEFLSCPASHEADVEEVIRIDTHAAIIFLAGLYAYKIKRELTLPYLDFSTLELRHIACLNEIRINKVSAPEIYLDVIPLVKTDTGHIRFGTDGEIVEWVLKMRRFDQNDLLANLADQQKLTEDIVDEAIREIIAFQNRSSTDCSRDGAKIISGILTSIIETLERHPSVSDRPEVREFTRTTSQQLALNAEYLRQRGSNGFIRRCHGDLHLANIVLINGRPRLFDAIEFDENIACIDVLYDAAFFIMDLWHRDCRKLSNYALNQFFQSSDLHSINQFLRVLPIFLGCRAGVRAMVALDRLSVIDPANEQLLYDEVKKYLKLANEFLCPAKPGIIAIGGRSGSGKSTLAKELAPMLGPPPGSILLRSDVYRKLLHGISPLERLGADAYTPENRDRLYESLLQRSSEILQAGKPVMVDASFLNPEHRLKFEDLASRADAHFHGLWLEAPHGVLTNRVISRKNDASDADSAVVDSQFETVTDPNNWSVVNTEGPIKQTLSKLERKLKEEIGNNAV